MYFEGRKLESYDEPVVSTDLREGEVYFAVNYVDDDMLIPIIETLVFLCKNLKPDDVGKAYFKDVESYCQGLPYDCDEDKSSTEVDVNGGSASFYSGPENELHHIFKYEQALEELMRCLLRRIQAGV